MKNTGCSFGVTGKKITLKTEMLQPAQSYFFSFTFCRDINFACGQSTKPKKHCTQLHVSIHSNY